MSQPHAHFEQDSSPSSNEGTRGAVELCPQNCDGVVRKSLGAFVGRFTVAGCLSAFLLISYSVAFVRSLRGRWFNPDWSTDDARQQTYPLWEALYPGLFDDDLVTEVMRGCLPPVHYWVSYGITLLTGDPVMTSHWVMLIQISLAVSFAFFAVRAMSSNVPAALSVVWLLHSRNTMQRMTGGLPRGWTPAIFAAFLFFATTKRHWATMSVIIIGVMLNPPGAMLVGVTYGALMLWRYISSQGTERDIARRNIVRSLAASPLFALLALMVVQRPAHIGQMVSLKEAMAMPEFRTPRGRFPFLPFMPVMREFHRFGYQAFIGRLYHPNVFWLKNTFSIIVASLSLIAVVGAVRRRIVYPAEVVLFGIASFATYLLARVLAFRLFVPDRHLQIPMVFVLICAFVVGIWRAFIRTTDCDSSHNSQPVSRLRNSWPALAAYLALGLVVFKCSGTGLKGDAAFNCASNSRAGMYQWIRDNTDSDALIACHPTHCNGVQLFGRRRALVTTETSHPFYPRYNLEMRRRSELSLRAQYAQSLSDLVTLLKPEGVTHFVFRRPDMKPENLKRATYFPPLDLLVKRLLAHAHGNFAFNQLPKQLDKEKFPYVVFVDNLSTIVDINALAAFLQAQGWTPPQSSMAASVQRHAASRQLRYASGLSKASEIPS